MPVEVEVLHSCYKGCLLKSYHLADKALEQISYLNAPFSANFILLALFFIIQKATVLDI